MSESYDIKALKSGLISVNINIENIKAALDVEEEKRKQYERLIMEAEIKAKD